MIWDGLDLSGRRSSSGIYLYLIHAGESKAAMVRRILVDGDPLPTQRVADGAADVAWLLDRAAAAALD